MESCGIDGNEDKENQRVSKKAKLNFQSTKETKNKTSNKSSFRILFPTRDQVLSTTTRGSEVICCNEKHWESKEFPKELFCNTVASDNGRKRFLFHSKVTTCSCH